jgi:hypothetical protein
MAFGTQPEEKDKKNYVMLPFIGLILIVSLAVLSYFVAPIIIDLLSENLENFDGQTEDIEDLQLRAGFAAVLWVMLLALVMLLASIFVGADPDKDAKIIAPPPGASQREIDKYNRQLKQARERKKAQLKRLVEKEEREKRRSGK